MRLQTNRSAESIAPRSATRGRIALAVVAAAWALGLAFILAHRVYVTNDSLSNYIHVWYISEHFWHGHGIPLHMPVLGHGEAYAFPYGFVPWFSAALLRPLFGDWIVTLWLVVGALGLIATQWWAFPELRGAWWTALLLANPMLVEGPLLGQLPFLWSVAMLFASIALWRHERWLAAGILLGLAQATHPAVMLPIVGPLILAWLIWEPRRARLMAYYALSLAIAAPAAWLVVASPSIGDSSTGTLIANFLDTVSLRAIVVAAPFIGLVVQRAPLARIPAIILVGLIALNVILVPIRKNEFAWTALTRNADESLVPFTRSPNFHAGATYRILRVADGKVGMYQLLRAGARLDSEPFPESIDRRSWQTAGEYAAFLQKRKVEYVIIYAAYDRRYQTNEHALLRELAAAHIASGSPCGGLTVSTAEYEVFAVRPAACAP